MNNPKLLHVYGQKDFHDDVVIVGTIEALVTLRKIIDLALSEGKVEGEGFIVGDGEGFDVIVVKRYDDFGGDFWNRLTVPYSDEHARENRENAISLDEAITDIRFAMKGDMF